MARRFDDLRRHFLPGIGSSQPGGVSPKETGKPTSSSVGGGTSQKGRKTPQWALYLVLLGAFCLGLAYFLINVYSDLGQVSNSLLATRGELASTATKLRDSQGEIVDLRQDLAQVQSEAELSRRQLEDQKRAIVQHEVRLDNQTKSIRSFGTRLESDRLEYQRELSELEMEKVDRTELEEVRKEVESSRSAGSTGGHQKDDPTTGPDELAPNDQQNMTKPDSVPPVQPAVPEPSTTVPATPESSQEMNTEPPRTPVPGSRGLAGQVYGFQLQEDDGVLWLLDVGLDLKKVDLKEARYDIEIRADGRKVRKKKQNRGDPIDFTVAGLEKPYRLVITDLDKDRVEGYLTLASR